MGNHSVANIHATDWFLKTNSKIFLAFKIYEFQRLLACAKYGAIRSGTLIKNAKGRSFLFFNCPTILIFKVHSCPEAVRLSRWEIFVGRVSCVRSPNCSGFITADG